MKKFLNEFKSFAMKGNVVDMAVGVIIGTAFGKIVTSFVTDFITPLLANLLGKVSFKDLGIQVGVSKIMYGLFLQTIFDFLIIALSIFTFITLMNKTRTKLEAISNKNKVEEVVEVKIVEPTEPSEEIKLLSEIRDLLKK